MLLSELFARVARRYLERPERRASPAKNLRRLDTAAGGKPMTAPLSGGLQHDRAAAHGWRQLHRTSPLPQCTTQALDELHGRVRVMLLLEKEGREMMLARVVPCARGRQAMGA